MVRVCNTVQPPEGSAKESNLAPWEKAYRDSDKLIASGSSYFVQAFAEVLGLVSDEELNDLARGRLRLAGIGSLLERAIREYEAAADFDSRSGLDEHHDRVLREAGLDEDGAVPALLAAAQGGLLSSNPELFTEIATTFVQRGFAALTQSYINRLRGITALLTRDAMAPDQLQGFTWILLTQFIDALQVGQAIAVLNTKAYPALTGNA